MLGIIIGVASVVALVSVAQGAPRASSNQLNPLGTNLLTVSPGFFRGLGHAGSFGSATNPPPSTSQRHLRPVRSRVRRPERHLQARDRGHPKRDGPHHRPRTGNTCRSSPTTCGPAPLINQASVDNKPAGRGHRRRDRGQPGPDTELDRLDDLHRRPAVRSHRDHAVQGGTGNPG